MAKRIIDSKTYNTETAARLASAAQRYDEPAKFDELYQTRHGAYFRYYGDWASSDHNGPLEEIQPLTPQQAQIWIEQNASTDLYEKHFGEQPEAGESESRITLRVPDRLKNRIEALAEANGKSLNAWMMRCLEGCAGHEVGLRPLVRRGYKFTGPNADRNKYIYGLFRLGENLELLGTACGITLPEVEQIVAEGNGGTMPTVFFDSGGDMVKIPPSE